jgi:hypothetical protein
VLGGTGKHLGFVLLAWAVFFVLAAWVLPPLDSRLQPTPLVYRHIRQHFFLLREALHYLCDQLP